MAKNKKSEMANTTARNIKGERTTIKFITFRGMYVPMAKVMFCGKDKEYLALLDTGSAITLFNERLFADVINYDHAGEEIEVSVTGISGELSYKMKLLETDVILKVVKGCMYSFKIAGHVTNLETLDNYYRNSLGVKDGVAMLIGSDIFTKLKAIFKYSNKTFILGCGYEVIELSTEESFKLFLSEEESVKQSA